MLYKKMITGILSYGLRKRMKTRKLVGMENPVDVYRTKWYLQTFVDMKRYVRIQNKHVDIDEPDC